jgi:transcriptional regulator with XRE-family HTH domain
MTNDHRAVVQALVAEADQRAAAALDQKVHKGEALARLLAEREGLVYKSPSVRAWMRGDAMPPADVLLAVARSVGISIDEQSRRQPDGSQQPAAERLEALEGQVASLQEVVDRLQLAMARERRQAQRREWARQSTAAAAHVQPAPGSGRSADRPRGTGR